MSLKYEIKKLQTLVLYIYQSLQITQNSKSLNCTIRVYLMLSKVNEQRLSVYKYLNLKNFSPHPPSSD
jgi:hypothetical protein